MKSSGRTMTVAMAMIFAGTACGGGGGASTTQGSGGGLVAFLLPSPQAYRWENQDGPDFVQSMKKYAPNVKVRVVDANADAAKQQAQAEAALADGAKVIVVAPVDLAAAGAIVTAAHKDHVPVIAYARPISNSPVDYFVTGDVTQMGKLQATWLAENTKDGDNIAIIEGSTDDANSHILHDAFHSVLDPLFQSGKRKLVADIFTPAWEPATAQREMEDILTKQQNNVQGVIGSNDGMSGGVIAALRGQNLVGKVKVTGLGASPDEDKRVLKGEQGMTVLIPIRSQADLTAQIAAALVKGEKPPASLFSDQPFVTGSYTIPRVLISVTLITKDKMDLVLQDGGVAKAQLCDGVPAGTGPC